jgi:uncharacterized membrane protein YdjX (TVP38/TMEM64 family)
MVNPVKICSRAALDLKRFPAALANRAGLVLLVVAVLAIALTLVWQFAGLSAAATAERVRAILGEAVESPWAPLFVVSVFLLGAATFFPVTILMLATAAVFGPFFGALYSALGIALSGAITYWIGARYGQAAVGRLLGKRGERLRGALRRRGVLAVIAVRVVPTLPFTLINLVIGASSIRPIDFVVGTILGMGPGLIVISLVGDRIVAILLDPSPLQLLLLGLCVAAWVALSIGAQALVSRLGRTA